MTCRPFKNEGSWSEPALPLSPDAAARLVGDSTFASAEFPASRQVGSARVFETAGTALGPDVPAVCAIGSFDGLHLGHRALIDAAAADSLSRGVPLALVTFDPDPSEVLSSRPPERLLPDAERVRSLALCGADALVVHDFSREFAAIPYGRYLLEELGRIVRPVSIHVGENFRFGAGGAGTPEAMSELGASHDFVVHGHALVSAGGEPVSSTRIRALLRAGEVSDAAALLHRAHFVEGRVGHGRGEGTSFGFPTANVTLDARDCVPKDGVYAGFVEVDGTAWPAAINVGTPPSFSTEKRPMLEANLIGFSGDIYGATVRTVFLRRLRPSRRFDSLAELEKTVLGNIEWVRENLGETAVEVGV